MLRALAWLGALMLLAAVALIAPYLTKDTELVRLRNALVLADDLPADFDWQPPATPDGFMLESAPAPAEFAAVAKQLNLAALPSDWARALAISAHLLGSHAPLTGGAQRSGLSDTYDAIVRRGGGNCADFVRAFDAIAVAAGMTVRKWAFSFDGFGGHGHVWVEIWNRQTLRWQLLDVFDNYYFALDSGEPLSAMALRKALLSGDQRLRMLPLYAKARPGYAIEDKAWAYIRRGLPQWYLVWGVAPFTYDSALAVRAAAGLSRSLEQLAAIVVGVHPAIRVLPEAANVIERKHVHRLSLVLRVSAWLATAGLVMLISSLWLQRRRSGKGGDRGH